MPEVTFLGHSCVAIADGDHKLIIDPFINDNPQATCKAEDIKVKWVLVTHGHGDHVGDAIEIAKRNDATIIANNELAHLCGTLGAKFHPMHIGGAHNFDFGRVKLTIAHHGGGYGPDASVYTGPPVGFLVTIGGKVIYHPGDTGLFLDMKPIGDNFTMGIEDACKATEFLQPKKVVPFHYDTWDIIHCDPCEFRDKVKGPEVILLKPGESLKL